MKFPMNGISLKVIQPSDREWNDVLDAANKLNQTDWFVTFDWHIMNQCIVAYKENEVVGFLRFVLQKIGLEDGCNIVVYKGKELIEAKILAFGVLKEYRNRGIGEQLQRRVLEEAKKLACYQVRSHSDGENIENHHLKFKLRYSFYPTKRGEDKSGGYFIKTVE